MNDGLQYFHIKRIRKIPSEIDSQCKSSADEADVISIET